MENVEFIPLQKERYDLVIKKEHFDKPEAVTMLRLLRPEKFGNKFKNIGGYDIRDLGKVIAET